MFRDDERVVLARAPGRLDVLGGIADYSGGLVLELPLALAAHAAAQRTGDGRAVAVSGERRIEVDVAALARAPVDELAARFRGADAWGAYVLGPVALLLREAQVAPPGLRVLVASEVPEGKGVASSAAVEIAVLVATAACLEIDLQPQRLALLGQQAEQLFAGAPCGLMDQLTVLHGESGCLLPVLCRPAEVGAPLPLPKPLAVWGIDSGVRHAVAGEAYRRVRCAAFMGKALLGSTTGYLAELDRAEVADDTLPTVLLGAEFLGRSAGVDDPVSTVEPAVAYPVRAATLFPLEEHARATEFVALLERPLTEDAVVRLGELLLGSHEGYSSCGLGDERTDAIVEAVRAEGPERGLYGARVSGGGSGGTVVVLGLEDAEPRVRAIAETLGAGVVGGSSPGAARYGVRVVGRETANSWSSSIGSAGTPR